MRKMIGAMKISIDGKTEGPEGYADWVDAWSDDFGLRRSPEPGDHRLRAMTSGSQAARDDRGMRHRPTGDDGSGLVEEVRRGARPSLSPGGLSAMHALAGCELSLSASDELWCEQSLKVSDQFNSLKSRGRQ
jgi:hypothetical protein